MGYVCVLAGLPGPLLALFAGGVALHATGFYLEDPNRAWLRGLHLAAIAVRVAETAAWFALGADQHIEDDGHIRKGTDAPDSPTIAACLSRDARRRRGADGAPESPADRRKRRSAARIEYASSADAMPSFRCRGALFHDRSSILLRAARSAEV